MTVIYTAPSEAPVKKPRRVMLPLLIGLFVISYAILTLLVVEQGRTIDAQRVLIHEMFKDSVQLGNLKRKLASDEAAARARSQASPNSESKDSASAPANPGAQTAPKEPSRPSRPNTKSRATKEVPPAPATDLQDVRRARPVI